ncbi:hypothetical protein [Brevibacterium sp. CFH 10365]|uniref:hypothetical protein n=1 Tax=Brevibacterium sp. CFH 10365 TaxID=2585207 RepID=UPI0012664CD4|nr:hypothetical protein [Brevibacterium sp. CFH 10365]
MDLNEVQVRGDQGFFFTLAGLEPAIPLDAEQAGISRHLGRPGPGRLRASRVVDDESAIITDADTADPVAVTITDLKIPAINRGVGKLGACSVAQRKAPEAVDLLCKPLN